MKISDSIKFADEFRRTFGLDLNDYLIPEMKILGEAVLNLPKLDDYLTANNKDYTEDMSMKDFIEKHYGERAGELVMELIK